MPLQEITPEVAQYRKPDYPIHPVIHNRWSPRSMTGESMSDEELLPLFEAARWAPSSFNEQPWTLLYAKRDTPEWNLFYDPLIEFNQNWTKNASVLVCFISRDTFLKNGKPSVTHSFDTGAAWMALALEGTSRGYVIHGMSGFDYQKARQNLSVPGGHSVEAMIAIGKRAPKELLPEEMQKTESPISSRKPLIEVAHMGQFPS